MFETEAMLCFELGRGVITGEQGDDNRGNGGRGRGNQGHGKYTGAVTKGCNVPLPKEMTGMVPTRMATKSEVTKSNGAHSVGPAY